MRDPVIERISFEQLSPMVTESDGLFMPVRTATIKGVVLSDEESASMMFPPKSEDTVWNYENWEFLERSGEYVAISRVFKTDPYLSTEDQRRKHERPLNIEELGVFVGAVRANLDTSPLTTELKYFCFKSIESMERQIASARDHLGDRC